MKRHLTHLWRLRLAHPREEIYQASDDIHAAFHRILYHPDLAIVFAHVFEEYLVIPVGVIFGGANSPGLFCLTLEVRAHLASFGIGDTTLTDLAQSIQLSLPPTPREIAGFAQAVPDSRHQPTPDVSGAPFHHSSFVDDNATAATFARIHAAINSSILAAYIVYGFPEENERRTPALSVEKWQTFISHLLRFLGFDIDSRRMVLIWPADKRAALRETLDSLWLGPGACRRTPREIASLLGVIRNAAVVFPGGIFLSLRLQHQLNAAGQRLHGRSPRRWWRTCKLLIAEVILADLRLLRAILDDDDTSPNWSRLIGLVIDRDPTSDIRSDASYEGLGGWSRILAYKWRLSREDLEAFGFDVKALEDGKHEPLLDAEGLHINVLEFLAIIINIYLALLLLRRLPVPVGGHVIQVLADNTSALSWLRYASRSHRPVVQRLARFVTSLLFHARLQGDFRGRHIPGRVNDEADALSRPRLYPTWASVTERCSLLSNIPAYRLPSELLQTLSSIVSLTSTEEPSAEKMTALLNLEPRILRTGSKGSAMTTSVSRN